MAKANKSPMTIQTGAHQFNGDKITDYSLFMGGLNVRHDVLAQYDPLTTGYWRIFMVREPVWLKEYFKDTNKFKAFKHIIEYGNKGVDGLSDISVEEDEIRGGYAGRSFSIPKSTSDGTNSLTIKVQEFSGSICRELTHTWINGSVDLMTNFAHYNGLIASGNIGYSQANQTAEFIYVVTDRTGMKVEYACQFCNCFPKNIPTSHFNSDAGEHNLVEYNLEFSCTKYEGYDVNERAKELLKIHQIMVNSLEYYSGISTKGMPRTGYNPNNGKIEDKDTVNKFKSGLKYTTDPNLGNANNSVPTVNGPFDRDGNMRPTPSYTDYANQKH